MGDLLQLLVSETMAALVALTMNAHAIFMLKYDLAMSAEMNMESNWSRLWSAYGTTARKSLLKTLGFRTLTNVSKTAVIGYESPRRCEPPIRTLKLAGRK